MSLVKTTQQLAISTGVALSKQFKGFDIRVRDTDGYIHATDMCKVGKKRWNDYYTNKRNKEFFEELGIVTGILVSELIQSIK
jgi:formylmethanofuran dehydrogenase subunit B